MMTRMQIGTVAAAALAASGCGQPEAVRFCEALDQVIIASKEVTPFASMSGDRRADKVATPAGFEGASGCSSYEAGGEFIYSCEWVSPTSMRPAGSKPIADSVKECLTPQGWALRKNPGPGTLMLEVYSRDGEAGHVALISTGDGGVFRDALMLRVSAAP